MTGLAASQAIVLRAITAAAEAGKVCPTNTELGDLMTGGSSVACGALMALNRKGIVSVQRFSRSRQVTIVATGATTRHEGSTAPHWRSKVDGRAHNDGGPRR